MKSSAVDEARVADGLLAARDPMMPALAAVLDNDRLSAMLGSHVEVTRVRYKPDTSLLVAFRGPGSGMTSYGWAMTRARHSASQLRATVARVSEAQDGPRIVCAEPNNEDTAVAVGTIANDRRLRRNLRWLTHGGMARLHGTDLDRAADGPTAVLRYKPERRLVVRVPSSVGALVLKVSGGPYDATLWQELLDRMRDAGVPLVQELADRECAAHGLRAAAAWGAGDLLAFPATETAFQAGTGLAALHRCARDDDDLWQRLSSRSGPEQLVAQLLAVQAMVGVLVPELTEVAARLTERLRTALEGFEPQGQQVLVHGDFSPDQILVSGGDVRIIDFDQVRTGERAADLGSFAAAEEIAVRRSDGLGPGNLTMSFLDGYRHAGGEVVPGRVELWAAHRLFMASMDPFRDRHPAWTTETSWHLQRALELLG
ncbi:MAG: aminoglycoside phosphotransferase family protein [Actinomycetota bacterium]|nr:aminoglycoside phosphotransferase family protein [Actinomycetota bacterium]